jgi:D-alanyl-lipoteichoic acid acyltransferase DltB (MBOAT superfamily)
MSDALNPSLGRSSVLPAESAWSAVGRQAIVLVQLLLAIAVVQLYGIEGPAFRNLFILATAGFAVNLVLPKVARLPFFVALSLGGAVLVFGVVDAAWLIGTGLVLIGLCHLPVGFYVRVAVLVAVGAGLAAARAGLVPSPWSAAVWPILGAMFMFRLALYLLATSRPDPKADRNVWWALAYFFMLPNLVFPLFPVVDYQTFRRTYYDKPDAHIYEQGLVWIARGLVHLLLYRFVYYAVLNDPIDVVHLSDLVQFMLGTFLLYLRVSGSFHLIVGLLHLFGFRLPETHKLYYLAHSFTELWRRINIYWTDFMMKTVFYPTYFRVKKLGPERALVVSTTAVFVTTWVLHSYQWFWLRGGFPLTWPDTLFWGILGALVVVGALRESRATKKPKTGVTGWDWRLGLHATRTFFFFCFLWSLWSTQSVTEWLWMMGSAFRVDLKGVLMVAAVFGTILVLGGKDWAASRARPAWLESLLQPAVRTAVMLLALLAVGQPALQANAPPLLASGLSALHTTGLNTRDAALQHRGYYEQLEVRGQVNAQVVDVVGRGGEHWQDLSAIGVLRERRDILLRDLHPSRSVLWNGHRFSTNRWGMRDQEYDQAKPERALRIALLGPSHVMGNGVGDGETFEALVEAKLNESLVPARYSKVEILNFGVDGYALSQQVAMLEERVFAFQPDIVIATHYERNRFMTERYLVKVVDSGVAIPDKDLAALIARAGLANVGDRGLPVPFGVGRAVVRWAGFDARMPSAEAEARARWVSEDVLVSSMRRFRTLTAEHHVSGAILALNAVIDDVPLQIPNLAVMREQRLPVLDLFDVFPKAERPALRVAPWDDHPNAAGHRLIADRLYAAIVPFINEVAALRAAAAPAGGGAPTTGQ